MRSFGGFLGVAVAGAIVVVAAGGCSRSELDLGAYADGGPSGDDTGTLPDGFIPIEGSPPPSCGNHVCDQGETCTSCALDCGTCSTCGNGNCDTSMGESCTNCPMDCGNCPSCGDGFCTAPEENCQNCAVDCHACPGCDDGTCTAPNETCFSCPQDCGACKGCGDGLCDMPSETCASCPQDCGSCDHCGNNVCEAPLETCVNCPADCGQCPVKDCLQEVTCAVGCLGGLGGGGGGGDAGLGGTIAMALPCISLCISEGCPTANQLSSDVVACFITSLTNGTCMGLNIGCLMNACSGQFAACLSLKCPPGQGG